MTWASIIGNRPLSTDQSGHAIPGPLLGKQLASNRVWRVILPLTLVRIVTLFLMLNDVRWRLWKNYEESSPCIAAPQLSIKMRLRESTCLNVKVMVAAMRNFLMDRVFSDDAVSLCWILSPCHATLAERTERPRKEGS